MYCAVIPLLLGLAVLLAHHRQCCQHQNGVRRNDDGTKGVLQLQQPSEPQPQPQHPLVTVALQLLPGLDALAVFLVCCVVVLIEVGKFTEVLPVGFCTKAAFSAFEHVVLPGGPDHDKCLPMVVQLGSGFYLLCVALILGMGLQMQSQSQDHDKDKTSMTPFKNSAIKKGHLEAELDGRPSIQHRP